MGLGRERRPAGGLAEGEETHEGGMPGKTCSFTKLQQADPTELGLPAYGGKGTPGQSTPQQSPPGQSQPGQGAGEGQIQTASVGGRSNHNSNPSSPSKLTTQATACRPTGRTRWSGRPALAAAISALHHRAAGYPASGRTVHRVLRRTCYPRARSIGRRHEIV
jgi:hypothetical protein